MKRFNYKHKFRKHTAGGLYPDSDVTYYKCSKCDLCISNKLKDRTFIKLNPCDEMIVRQIHNS
jgi:hypothetical protein